MIKITYKILNLSLPRTGTSSFISAMKKNGFKTSHWNVNMCHCFMQGDYNKIYNFVKNNDVFADFPWALIYEKLDSNFKFKFIYFKRDADDWIKSCLKYFDLNKNPAIKGGNFFREHFFGSSLPKNNEQKYLDFFYFHENNIKNYFKNKKNFIAVDLGNEGWEVVCDFLNLSKMKFPHLNKSSD